MVWKQRKVWVYDIKRAFWIFKNACFENELTKQIEKVTVENGFDAKALLPI
jgi:hypothetical protein